ncbi:hypothetical protein CIG19_18775 [Enterobacterales bacterium CwR94]|nr:hypothetical protein CIG19_18775 [Enterobacterales bacterium CwR94]
MKYSELSNIKDLDSCLLALAEVTAVIEQTKLQLEYPQERDDGWHNRAAYALKKNNGIRAALCARLAIFRQQEKKENIIAHNTHADFMVKELMKYVPDAVIRACSHRAKLKLGELHAQIL